MADTAQGSFGGLQSREADLARDLEEKKGAPAAAEAARDAASADAQTEPRAESPAPKRYEFGSQDDFQLQQAMKHLKGHAGGNGEEAGQRRRLVRLEPLIRRRCAGASR